MKKTCSICGRIHEVGERCPFKPVKKYKKYSELTDFEKEYKAFLSSSAWQKKREEIKERDFYLCPICTAKGRYDKKRKYDPQNLQVHHIESVRMAWTKRFENNNLITLCEKHHREAEDGKISKETLRTYIEHIPPGLKV